LGLDNATSLQPRCGRAGFPNGKGGRYAIWIDGARYYTAPLAWFYQTGSWPKNKIDHRDRNPRNDRFINLREATVSQNSANKGLRSDNKSGYIGVFWHWRLGKWGVRIDQTHVGFFDDIEEAAAARDEAALREHKEFAVLNLPKEEDNG
jgi:hypothetical protein